MTLDDEYKEMIKTDLFLTDTAVHEKFIQGVVLGAMTHKFNTKALLVGCEEIGRLLIRQTGSK